MVSAMAHSGRFPLALLLAALLLQAATHSCCAQPDQPAANDGGIASSEAGPNEVPVAPSAPAKARVYIVRMAGVPPVAGNEGGVTGFAATAPRTRAAQFAANARNARNRLRSRLPRIDLRTGAVRSFVKMLGRMQEKVATDVGVPLKNVLYSYKYVSNGFSAKLTPAQVQRLKSHPDVADVFPSITLRKLTSDSTAFMRLPESLWAAGGGQESAGEDVVVGVVDTGIWPEHPSFADNTTTPYGPPPQSWRGICQSTSDFPSCNNKLVGARFLVKGFREMAGDEDLAYDWLSARDADGHGTWCAGAAAGNSFVEVATSRGQVIGPASGVAPRARLAAYKVFWSSSDGGGMSASWADVEAAVNYAVADGVDVLSLSLGGLDSSTNYFSDLPYLYANLAGVTVVYAAGNAGPPQSGGYMYRTISNFSPFYLTVGASSIGRRFLSSLTLGDSTVLEGAGFGGGQTSGQTLAVAEGIASRRPFISLSKGDQCLPFSLEPSKVAGRFVLCSYGGVSTFDKVTDLQVKGAAGLLLYNVPRSLASFTPYDERLPVVYLGFEAADSLRTYIRAASEPTVLLSDTFEKKMDLPAPSVAYFSSTGPVTNPYSVPSNSYPTNDLLKPDIVAPGVSLWSAWRGSSPGEASQEFGMISGTSMATPHMAGVAALLVQRYPNWTPAQIMSAIMTTAVTTQADGSPITSSRGVNATVWEMGAGQVNPTGLLDPGLTYNAGPNDYFGFLAGQNSWRLRSLVPSRAKLVGIKAYNLNRPTIAVARMVKNAVVMRTVTNVGAARATYIVSVVSPPGVAVTVTPTRIALPVGGTAAYSVRLSALVSTLEFRYGSLTWADAAGHSVRSVIAVQPITKDTPAVVRKSSRRK